MITDFVAIPAITVLCYLAAEVFKSLVTPAQNRHVPVLCAVVGLLLGIACHLWLPGYIPAENPVVAAAIGAVSGWAATGINQSIKQEQSK